MTTAITKGFITPDKMVFTTQAEANNHLRAPLVEAALKKVTGGDAALAQFLKDNEDEVLKAFEVGTISRVTKAERNKLRKALDEVKSIANGKLKFLQDNADAMLDSFRWPAVKRLKDEEKAAETKKMLAVLADEKAADWIIANQAAILSAYDAGKEKRVANPKAMAALEKARETRAALKAAATTGTTPAATTDTAPAATSA